MPALKGQFVQDWNLTSSNWKDSMRTDQNYQKATFDTFEIVDYIYHRYFSEEFGKFNVRLGPQYDPKDAEVILKLRRHPNFGQCITVDTDIRRKDHGVYYSRYQRCPNIMIFVKKLKTPIIFFPDFKDFIIIHCYCLSIIETNFGNLQSKMYQ